MTIARAIRIAGARDDTNDTKSPARDIPTIPMRFRLASVTG
jgi:hypothetical protein